ncbi:16S rRNA (uracil(1498)-N(3))-methyltransferase [Luteimonas aestuarii]|uniref:Ribosomal RNA small subunit methyltransferase E n=1 Tax=Luteimonas aestuarii TaxID=453837 RepID=A0A4R5TJF2_9GAMM|nr:16S rRNA (uracil(1498)-N(3))-methyltransferase [Luteimonas aestuarii]TDK21695.1 16S rRNA (uracil(1498)-N(3))-methyltransferase [Luteimonas aestuarii]
MRMIRAYVDLLLEPGARVTLPEAAAGHLVRVLRLREGDPCVLFNGDGHDYDARLVEAGKRGVVAEIGTSRAVDNESPLRIVLLQGIARGEKMDLILQKATELGVARIVPVDAERTEVRLEGERLRKRVAHWHSVVASACEQCGRARLPGVDDPVAITNVATNAADASLRLTLDPLGTHRLPALSISAPATIAVAIGPEGGWSPRDRAALEAAGFEGLRLGPRILRTETAGLSAIAALQAIHGDLGGAT